MGRYENLEQLLTANETAQERGDMPLETWAAKLREYRDLRKQKEPTKTVAIVQKAPVGDDDK